MIDTETLRASHPILNIASADVVLTPTRSGYYWGPCPFCQEGEDRFKVWPESGQFYCRRCEKKGDVIAYVMARRGLSFVDACKWLNEADQTENIQLEILPRRSLDNENWIEWQVQADKLATAAIYHLLGQGDEAAAKALKWLKARGIRPKDCANFGIGFNDSWREIVPGYRLPPGITLPRYCPDSDIMAINVYLDKEARQLTGKRRMYAAGSRPKDCLYNSLRLTDEIMAVVVCEGELDAVLISRFLSPHAIATATGGASMIPDNLDVLDGRRVVVIPHNDEAGTKAAGLWRERVPDCVIARVPADVKDVTDYWLEGGDLVGFVANFNEGIG